MQEPGTEAGYHTYPGKKGDGGLATKQAQVQQCEPGSDVIGVLDNRSGQGGSYRNNNRPDMGH